MHGKLRRIRASIATRSGRLALSGLRFVLRRCRHPATQAQPLFVSIRVYPWLSFPLIFCGYKIVAFWKNMGRSRMGRSFFVMESG